MARLMASLSARRRTSLLAGPLGTLPTFGDTTCAQDAVVPPISSIKLHSVLITKALPLAGQALSERSCITIVVSPCCIFNFVLCTVFSLSGVAVFYSRRCLIKLGNPPDDHSAPCGHLCVRSSIGEPGRMRRRQLGWARPAGVHNRQSRRVVFPAIPMQ